MSQSFLESLLERRNRAWEQAKSLLDTAESEGRDLSGEEEQTWQRLNADMDAIDKRAQEYKEAEDRAEATRKTFEELMQRTPTEPKGSTSAERSEDAAIRAFLQGETRSYEARATMVTGTDPEGGHTVPRSFYGRLVEHMIENSGVLQAGPTVLDTAGGEPLDIPITDTFSDAAVVSEGSAIPQSEPTFNQRQLGSFKYGQMHQISPELVSDSGVDILSFLARQSGRAMGNALGAHLLNGTGTGQPRGIMTDATVALTGDTGLEGGFTYENLVDLQYSVISPYRRSAVWLMNDATVGELRKLTDGNGQPLWQPSIQVGAPGTVLGHSVVTDPNMPTTALDAKSVLFGDFSVYYVRRVSALRFERSDDYAFNTDLITYRTLLRADGTTVDRTGGVKVFQGASS